MSSYADTDGDDEFGVGALGVPRIGGDNDAAQSIRSSSGAKGRDFIALRGALTLSDHGLAGVQHGGEQVDGRAVGVGTAHGLAVDGQTDESVAGFVDRNGGVPRDLAPPRTATRHSASREPRR